MRLTNYPITVTDQLGFTVTLHQAPKSIISLVPSITITLFDLGLGNSIIGRTKFCIHPQPSVQSIPIVGGTKNLNIHKIRLLQPDLVIANKEENEPSSIHALKTHCKVYVSDVKNLSDNYHMIEQIGVLTNTSHKAQQIISKIKLNFNAFTAFPQKKAAYFIWRQPYMVAGHSTFINHLLKRLHLVNVFENLKGRYPQINTNQLKQIAPELIFLSSEPYPFKQKHIDELKTIVPQAKIILVDGEMFSWFGSKMIAAPNYFNALNNLVRQT